MTQEGSSTEGSKNNCPQQKKKNTKITLVLGEEKGILYLGTCSIRFNRLCTTTRVIDIDVE